MAMLALFLAALAAVLLFVAAFLVRPSAPTVLVYLVGALVVTVWLVLPAWTAAT